MFAMCVPEGQKRVSDTLELELQMLGIKPRFSRPWVFNVKVLVCDTVEQHQLQTSEDYTSRLGHSCGFYYRTNSLGVLGFMSNEGY